MPTTHPHPSVTLHHADALEALRAMPDSSVDSVVTDPPYGLSGTDPSRVVDTLTRWATGEREYIPDLRGFMGASWDAFVPPPAVWDECLRVLRPGGYLLAFAGTRTYDLMTLSVRFAGFDIREGIAWVNAQGYPKSVDVETAVARAAGPVPDGEEDPSAAWHGWGTSLKPSFEPVVVARKPLEGTLGENVLRHGTGGVNVDGCRVPASVSDRAAIDAKHAGMDLDAYERPAGVSLNLSVNPIPLVAAHAHEGGRWPSNVLLDEDAARSLDASVGEASGYVGAAGASRFYPVFPALRFEAKAPTSERPSVEGVAHVSVKPVNLMRWLVRLVTPPGGVVLEPFAGSGTTVEAALLEGREVVAVEREAVYLPLIEARVASFSTGASRHRSGSAEVLTTSVGEEEDGLFADLL